MTPREPGAAERSAAELNEPGASETPGSCKHRSSGRQADNLAAPIRHDRSCRPGQRRHRSWSPPRELPGAAARRLRRQSQIPDRSGDEAATHRDAAGGLADHAAWLRRPACLAGSEPPRSCVRQLQEA